MQPILIKKKTYLQIKIICKIQSAATSCVRLYFVNKTDVLRYVLIFDRNVNSIYTNTKCSQFIFSVLKLSQHFPIDKIPNLILNQILRKHYLKLVSCSFISIIFSIFSSIQCFRIKKDSIFFN